MGLNEIGEQIKETAIDTWNNWFPEKDNTVQKKRKTQKEDKKIKKEEDEKEDTIGKVTYDQNILNNIDISEQ
jgi:isoaspartyl peptidase/L-asparaginase-like protein (Ntn-hydrolase superfamily)